jgi:2-phospho-L-lactate guanylyltransferase
MSILLRSMGILSRGTLTVHGDLTQAIDGRDGLCALIAIKERGRCKTRLAGSLAAAARVELVRSMLAGVLAATRHAQTVRQTIVVSPERDQIPAEVPVLADAGTSLNAALEQAHRVLRELGCQEFLVLAADLPRITAADVDTLVNAGRASGFAIAPDASGVGTNALCFVSMHPFRFQFGPDSRSLHLQEARRMGMESQVVRLPGLAFDLDSPADLELLGEQSWPTRLRA